MKNKVVETIDLTPTWESAVLIYCAVLENPDAGLEAKHAAREDLLSLGRAMDKIRSATK
jgi:hypothetical protein